MTTSMREHVLPRPNVFPRVLDFTDVRLYSVIIVFVALDVGVPWVCHQVHPLAGPTFLPMFFFSMLAALLFGWRAGLLVGFLTPLISYGLSGMPILDRLPQIVVENSALALSVGLLRERFKLNILWSVIGAVALGHVALGLALLMIHSGEVNPLVSVWRVVDQGWPGIAIQVACLPLIVKGLDMWFSGRDRREERGES